MHSIAFVLQTVTEMPNGFFVWIMDNCFCESQCFCLQQTWTESKAGEVGVKKQHSPEDLKRNKLLKCHLTALNWDSITEWNMK